MGQLLQRWAGGIGGFYGLLKTDVISYTSLISFAKSVGVDRIYDLDTLNPNSGKLAVAVIANEIAEPIRIPLVLLTLNPMLRIFRNFRGKAF